MTPLAAYLLLFVAVGVGFIFVHLVAGKLIRPSRPDAEKKTIYECGEPTIGSAWIQFDVRFYVVALLFVIFDVEVAFFFPWAEVFGKANAIANTEKPTTAAEYQAYADKVLDLAVPYSSFSRDSEDPQRLALIRYEIIAGRTIDGRPLLDAKGEATPWMTREHWLVLKTLTGRQFDGNTFVDAGGKPRFLTEEELDKLLKSEQEARAKFIEFAKEKKKGLTAEEENLVVMDGPLKQNDFERNRTEARNLVGMALYEVLVFFGVLLVGFAYLWRRGDLAWVRSTAAEAEAETTRPKVGETKKAAKLEEEVAAV
jgi:NADH:ubiquinone oxidoreductase subunit 3 (subunit A)